MTMEKNALREQSLSFAIAVSNVCDNIKGLSIYVNQLMRSSSSIGANLHEAKFINLILDMCFALDMPYGSICVSHSICSFGTRFYVLPL